jgi:predicted PurR-regulated permease PerM
MEEKSSRFVPGTRKAAAVAAALGIAVFGIGAGFAVSGCGSDDNKDVNNAIDSVQSQASSVQSQISTALTNAQQQAQSVQSQVQSQAQSVQSQVSTAKDQYGY